MINNTLSSKSQNKQAIKEIMAQYHLRPLKGLRQNFLIDQNVIEDLIEISNVKKDDKILEIGAGLGFITERLSREVKRVIAVEKDKNLYWLLKEKLNKYKNIELIQGDVLTMNINKMKNYKVVANLPFNITFEVIKKFLTLTNYPKILTLIVQREVGERICPKSNKNNFWSIFVQLYAQAKIIKHVSRQSFWPVPKAEVVIIQIKPKEKQRNNQYKEKILKLIKMGFKYPRKQLINNLREGSRIKKNLIEKWLRESKIPAHQRAEQLSLKDWNLLLDTYHSHSELYKSHLI